MMLKRGSMLVKIYSQTGVKGYRSFTVVHYEDGMRERSTFSDLALAREHADVVLERLNRGADSGVFLRGAERLAYVRALEALEPSGTALDVAASEYAQAIELLKGRGSLLEAVRCFDKRQGDQTISRRVQAAVDELIATREKDGSSHRHIGDLRSRLDRFAKSFQCDIADVKAGEIQDFLLGLKLSPKSINNFRTAISNLFSFARLKRYVAKDHKPMEEVKEVKEPEREVGIYTPAEVQLLIQHAPPKFLAYVVIAAFAGLRQSEIERLEWHHVSADYIRVPGGERRTKSRRLVKLQDNLKQWLAGLRQTSGRVVPFANVSNQVMALCKNAKVESRHNGLRHSYASYRLAIVQDPARVADEMGNSPKIVQKHYRQLVTPEQAKAWFDIAPEQPKNLLSFTPAQAEVKPPVAENSVPLADGVANPGVA